MKLTTRMVSVRGKGPQTLNEENRSVEFAAATEIPARVWDWDRGLVDEILIMGGVALPGNKQVPFLDSHNRNTVDDMLGSMRDFRAEGGELVGRAYFSKRQKAVDAWSDVREGITDVSVGYEVTEATWVPDGEKAVIGGREYSGPVKVSTRWNLREVSLTPIGADTAAKVRSEPVPVAGKIDSEPTPPVQPVPTPTGAGQEIKQEETPMAEIDKPQTPPTPPAPPNIEEIKRPPCEEQRHQRDHEACVPLVRMPAQTSSERTTVEQAIRAVHAEIAKTMKPVPRPHEGGHRQ
jgi:hypothetical protein